MLKNRQWCVQQTSMMMRINISMTIHTKLLGLGNSPVCIWHQWNMSNRYVFCLYAYCRSCSQSPLLYYCQYWVHNPRLVLYWFWSYEPSSSSGSFKNKKVFQRDNNDMDNYKVELWRIEWMSNMCKPRLRLQCTDWLLTKLTIGINVASWEYCWQKMSIVYLNRQFNLYLHQFLFVFSQSNKPFQTQNFSIYSESPKLFQNDEIRKLKHKYF